MIDRLLVYGVGLIGGSVALALKRVGAVGEVVGVGRGRANLDAALARGIIDRIAEDVDAVVAEADLILLAVPVGAMAEAFAQIAPRLTEKTLITDVGSTKQDVIAAAHGALGLRIGQFVPAHPIAGAEHSGAAAARADLYQGRSVIVTPLPENSATARATVAALWQTCAAQVVEMAADAHDRLFAAVSHLPHLAAFALVDELADRPQAEQYFRHAGSGFRDFTRIAASSPEMWRDIALANRAALLAELEAYLARLGRYHDALAAADGAALLQSFAQASAARRRWASPSTENDV